MTRARFTWPLVLAIAVVSLVARIAAHPGAASDVVIEVRSGRTIDVLLTMHPDALLLKLQALADPSAAPAASIAAHRRALIARMNVRADNGRLDLEWAGLEAPQALEDRRSGKVVARMRAVLPPGVRTITFQTELIFGSYPLIVRHTAAPDAIVWLQGAETSEAIPVAEPRTQSTVSMVVAGLALGFTHIVPKGLDHVCFILGLFLLTSRIRPLLLQVSVFTIAHTLTLATTALGFITPPAALIEPLIALSIVFVACENILRTDVSRWRLGLVFLFGLLHGMGFAGVLTTMELSTSSLITTLVSFNVGVELAQIAVLAAAAAIGTPVVARTSHVSEAGRATGVAGDCRRRRRVGHRTDRSTRQDGAPWVILVSGAG